MSRWRHLGIVAARLIVAAAAIGAAVLLFRQLLLPAIGTALALTEPQISIVRRGGILLAALLAYWAAARWYERRTPDELRPAPVRALLAAGAGALMISITSVALLAGGVYSVTDWRGLQAGAAGLVVVIGIAALLEELVFRGVLFRILERGFGSSVALWLQALAFGAVHLGNVDTDVAQTITTMLSVTLCGAMWACLYVHTRNLWAVAAHHAAWNLAIALSGAPLSGSEDWRGLALLEIRDLGPAWLSGGLFGPENSIITLCVMAIAIALMVRLAQRRDRWLKPER
jgi:membrane protease YdiL (CAAX protease family)